MTPFITYRTIRLSLPTDSDRRAHDQRIKDALDLGPVQIPLSLLRSVHTLIGAKSKLACAVARCGNGYRLVELDAGRSFSIALDLGTTNLAALLYDNIARTDVLTRSLENPQIAFGSDIMTRMHCSITGRADEVHQALLSGVNDLIASLCREAGVASRDVHGLTVAGNTAMTHFFLGLDICTIPVDPFVPVVRAPGFLAASELGLGIHPEASVYVFPNAGSYVGGDITAGILASGMHESDETSILIDVGTNAEVVIGNRDWMIVGAGAAGPALEGDITRIGKRAKTGIIYDVEIRGKTVSCRTFDRGRPEGICGSGMVSLLHELYQAGLIDRSGTLTSGEHVTDREGERSFSLSCGGANGLFITQAEIQNFMKSKAAMFTLLLVLTRSVGISFRDIKNVYVSGALGTGINAEKAAGIGMLPAWPAEIVKPLGNSSLAGARLLLADGGLLDAVNAIAARITYKHMHDDPEFMKEFMGAVFIPHTNPDLLAV